MVGLCTGRLHPSLGVTLNRTSNMILPFCYCTSLSAHDSVLSEYLVFLFQGVPILFKAFLGFLLFVCLLLGSSHACVVSAHLPIGLRLCASRDCSILHSAVFEACLGGSIILKVLLFKDL